MAVQQSDSVRVLLVDDHNMVRQGLRSLLNQYQDIYVVGEAGDGEEAIAKVAEANPSVVLMDITMPRMDGVTATRLIKARHPEVAVLGLSFMTGGHQVEALLRAGAVAVLAKERAPEDLYRALKSAVA